jgi:hypothetical protein
MKKDITLDEILDAASRRHEERLAAMPDWERRAYEINKAYMEESVECGHCHESHPRRDGHYKWCAWRD